MLTYSKLCSCTVCYHMITVNTACTCNNLCGLIFHKLELGMTSMILFLSFSCIVL